MKKRTYLFIGITAAFAFLAAGIFVRLEDIPAHISLTRGSSHTFELNLPFSARVDAQDFLQFSGTSLKDAAGYDMNDPLTVTSGTVGEGSFSLNLFGFIPVKTIDVTVHEETLLYPGGQSIGVMLYTDGALIVGSSAVAQADGSKINPAQRAGLRAGDVIRAVNGVTVSNSAHLAELVNTSAQPLTLTIDRSGSERTIAIDAVEDTSGALKLGIWVRDSTAGVGTLTFYNPETGDLAGLGHAITDVDTGNTLQVKNGEIILSAVTEVVKGTVGSPGELKGYFDPSEEVIGYIAQNTDCGIFGESTAPVENGICGAVVAASRDEITEGTAILYASVDDTGVKEYSCEIHDIVKNADTKNFVVEITDEALLECTGGIVQGMSGSPILQNGKLIGAVTHVLINDPTKGYGIFIENMLEAAG